MNISATAIAWTFYGVFLVLAALGFVSEYLPTEEAFLETNTILNFTHLVTAIGFAAASKKGVGISIQFIQIIGAVYILISLIGFMGVTILMDAQWADVIYLNLLSYLQFGLGIIISVFGTILSKRQPLRQHSPVNSI